MIITIDGPAGTGKSTVAKQVADSLHFKMFDTGALYRAISAACLNEHIDPKNESQLASFIQQNPLTVNLEQTPPTYIICGKNVFNQLRTQEVSSIVSYVAANATVRKELLPLQRTLAHGHNMVTEGRDMGTTIFPDAEVKLYLTATAHERARRRFLELQEKKLLTDGTTLEMIEEQINKRDAIDSQRQASPLKKPLDALEIDTSDMAIAEVVKEIVDHVRFQFPSLT